MSTMNAIQKINDEISRLHKEREEEQNAIQVMLVDAKIRALCFALGVISLERN